MSYTLSKIHPDDRRGMAQVRALLEQEGISLDGNLDYTCGLFDEDDNLAATGSSFGSTLRCFAVDRAHQGEGLLNQIVSHLVERLTGQGRTHLFVYTKVSAAKFFQDLGFYEIARVEGALAFLENRKNGFARFCARLSQSRTDIPAASIVMNANPFTLGHLALVERAAREFPAVHLFVLEEDASLVPFAVRWKLVTEGVARLPHVVCHRSGPYLISSATFPGYFLKDEAAVIQGHARLDLALFGQIAKSLNITARYAGEEPSSQVTGLYNQVMAQELPKVGIQFIEVPRASLDGMPISASTVRKLIHDGNLEAIRPLVPDSTWKFFHTPEAAPVIAAIQAAGDVVHY